MSKSQNSVSPATALKIVSLLQKQAKAVTDSNVKKILLTAGCEIADVVIKQEGAVRKAA